jgi:glycosyltransferase involved in cell wall biosynthesis
MLMKVLHYMPNYSVISETFLYDQIIELEQHNINNYIVTSKYFNIEERPFNKLTKIPLRTLLHERITQKLAFGYEWLPIFINYKEWRATLSRINPTLVHCHMGNGAKTWLHIQNKLKLKIPTLISLHGSDVTMEPFLKPKFKQLLSEAGTLSHIQWTVPSEFLKKKAIDNLCLPSEKVYVINNGFNQRFSNSLSFDESKQLKLLSIGRFIGCKGQKFLLYAFALLIKKHARASLTLVGTGPLQAECKELALQLGVSDSVTFIDSLPHHQIIDIMVKHNLYVQPSIKDPDTLQEESFGVAALEALAIGLPTVVTNCGGLPEVTADLPNNIARVAKPADAASLCEQIDCLFKDTLQLPHSKREFIQDKFSMTSNATKVKALYMKLSQS